MTTMDGSGGVGNGEARPLARARPKPLPAVEQPMTAIEAEAALAQLNSTVIAFAQALVTFDRRRGWAVLGYDTCEDCLIARLRVGLRGAQSILRAAKERAVLAGLTDEPQVQQLAWSITDSAALSLAKVVEPATRLRVLEAVAKRNGGGHLAASVVRAEIKRFGCRVRTHPKQPDHLSLCPVCRGNGRVKDYVREKVRALLDGAAVMAKAVPDDAPAAAPVPAAMASRLPRGRRRMAR